MQFKTSLGFYLPLGFSLVSLLIFAIAWIFIIWSSEVDSDYKDFVDTLVKRFKTEPIIPTIGNFTETKAVSQKNFVVIIIIIIIFIYYLERKRNGNTDWLESKLENLKKLEKILKNISGDEWNFHLENKLRTLSNTLDELLTITKMEGSQGLLVDEVTPITDMVEFPRQMLTDTMPTEVTDKPGETEKLIIEIVIELGKNIKHYEDINEIEFNEKQTSIEDSLNSYYEGQNNEKFITWISKVIAIYSTIILTGVYVVIGLAIFVSNIIILTETTGSCDSDKDCYASNRDTPIGPLDINRCYDYLRNNFSIHCYSYSVNYVFAISKSGSTIAFGNFFLVFEVAVLVLTTFGSKTKKYLRSAALLFCSINIIMFIFYLGSVASISIDYHYKSNGTITTAYLWEIFLGYLINLTLTLLIPIILTSITFTIFVQLYYTLLQ